MHKRTSVKSLGPLPAAPGACFPSLTWPRATGPWRLPSHVVILGRFLWDPDLTLPPPPPLPAPVPQGTTPVSPGRCRELSLSSASERDFGLQFSSLSNGVLSHDCLNSLHCQLLPSPFPTISSLHLHQSPKPFPGRNSRGGGRGEGVDRALP